MTQATATSSRGGVFRWIDPADGTVKTRPTTAGESFVVGELACRSGISSVTPSADYRLVNVRCE